MVIPDHMWHAGRAAAEGAGESAPDNADDIVPEIGDWRAFKSRLLASSGDPVSRAVHWKPDITCSACLMPLACHNRASQEMNDHGLML